MRALLWLLRDALRAFRREAAIVVATGIAGNATQLGALALVLATARSLEQGSRFGLAPTTSITLAGGVMLLALGFAAALLFLSRTRAVALTRGYEDLLVERIVDRAATMPDGAADPDRVLPLLRSSSRRSARIVGKWLGAVQPVGLALGLIAFLLWLDLGFTLLLLVLVVVGLAIARRARRTVVDAVEHAKRRAALASKARRAMRRAPDGPGPRDPDERLHALLGPEAAGESAAYFETLRARALAALATDGWLAAAIPLVLVTGGLAAARGAWSWSAFVAYLVSAQALLGSTATVARIAFSTGRAHHHVEDVVAFLAEGRLPDRDADPLPVDLDEE